MTNTQHPFVVLRAMAAVYVKRPVRFVDDPSEPMNKVSIVVHCPGALRSGKITPEARQRLIETVKDQVRTGGCSQCIVLGPKEALYVEPDGTVKQSTQPPSGGVVLKDVVATEGGTTFMTQANGGSKRR
jgi:hypothetical protein